MDTRDYHDVQLTPRQLRGRTFLLGNKRAFSLSLPAAAGASDTLLHPHKWFGAYLYGRKFVEGQVVRAHAQRSYLLGSRHQTGFNLGLTAAQREYEVESLPCSEQFFVPDGIQGFVCTLTGDVQFTVEPELDIRFARALSQTTDGYDVEEIDNGVIVSNTLPAGSFDDATETFLPGPARQEETRLYAAVQVVADGGSREILPPDRRVRRKVFRKDQQRHRFVAHSAPGEAVHDHAPLWSESRSRVYAPVRFHFYGHGSIVYGFGATREEALNQLAALRDNLVAFQAQKRESALEILSHARFESGSPRVDTAYTQVLTRLMDALVARHAVAEDTVLDRPATMILAGNQYFHDSWKRDENIALGFLLALGFYDLARDVIRDTWRLQDETTGRLPQRIRPGEELVYHSSDGTLWALWRLYQYWRCTGDGALLHEKLPMVQRFFQAGVARAIDGMLPSGRVHHPDYLWETWMDTPHTPRDGFPIEIQMLWIACLRVFRPILGAVDLDLEAAMERAERLAWQAMQRFNVRGVPADSLDAAGVVRDLITPNPYFCFGLELDLGPETEAAMRDVGRRQLAGRQGIVTLAPQDWERVFSPEFLCDPRRVRGGRMRSIGKLNYHQGIEWNWLSQFFVKAELKYGEPDVAYRKYSRRQVAAALDHAGIGGISELFDLSGTRGPEFQAWSMSGFLEGLHAYAGVQIDVPGQRITVAPQLPEHWPGLSVRKWYGAVPLDVRYTGDDRRRTLEIEFPWGEAPEADIECVLVLPSHREPHSLVLSVDDTNSSPPWRLESVPGSDGVHRVRFTVRAHTRIVGSLELKRSSRPLHLSA